MPHALRHENDADGFAALPVRKAASSLCPTPPPDSPHLPRQMRSNVERNSARAAGERQIMRLQRFGFVAVALELICARR